MIHNLFIIEPSNLFFLNIKNLNDKRKELINNFFLKVNYKICFSFFLFIYILKTEILEIKNFFTNKFFIVNCFFKKIQ